MRHALNILWAGADNSIASTAEDVLVVTVQLALLLSPLVGLLLLVAAGAVLCYTLPRLWRRYRALVRRCGACGIGPDCQSDAVHTSHQPGAWDRVTLTGAFGLSSIPSASGVPSLSNGCGDPTAGPGVLDAPRSGTARVASSRCPCRGRAERRWRGGSRCARSAAAPSAAASE